MIVTMQQIHPPASGSEVTSPLDSMACFALYSASNAVGQAHRAALAPWNLTYTQYIALVVLADASDASAGLSVSELGTRLASIRARCLRSSAGSRAVGWSRASVARPTSVW